MKARKKQYRKQKRREAQKKTPSQKPLKAVIARPVAEMIPIVCNVYVDLPYTRTASSVPAAYPTCEQTSAIPMDHDHFPISSSSFVGINQPLNIADRVAYGIDELKADGYRVVPWDGR